MVFSNLFFLFVFLPLNLLFYSLAKTIRTRNIIMLLFSLFFYAWGEPVYVFLLIGMAFADWFFARLIQIGRDRRSPALARGALIGSLVVSLGLLGAFKYTGFLAETLHQLTGFPSVIPQIALPIGISFYTFQLISYVVDVYRGEVKAQKKFWLLLMYVSLFHQCIAGPIVRYQDVNQEILSRRATKAEISRGISRFCTGLAKKALLANSFGALADTLILSDAVASNAASLAQNLATIQARPVLSLWLGVFAFMLQIYLDFSAYSDMAIGMGLMIGFHYKENFDYPYLSHGASWNFVLWGLYFFVFIAAERLFLGRILERIPVIFSHLYLLIVVFFGWAIFRFRQPVLLNAVLGGMFGANGNPLTNFEFNTVFLNYVFFLIAAVIATTPLLKALGERFSSGGLRTAYAYNALQMFVPPLLLLLSTAALVGNSYNPFLYFQF